MDCFDKQILQFTLAWAPYGGSRNEDTFPEFGITADELAVEFHRIVATQLRRVRDLANSDRLLLARASAYVARARAANRDARQKD